MQRTKRIDKEPVYLVGCGLPHWTSCVPHRPLHRAGHPRTSAHCVWAEENQWEGMVGLGFLYVTKVSAFSRVSRGLSWLVELTWWVPGQPPMLSLCARADLKSEKQHLLASFVMRFSQMTCSQNSYLWAQGYTWHLLCPQVCAWNLDPCVPFSHSTIPGMLAPL